MESAVMSTIFLPPISTFKASSRKRLPLHFGHGSWLKKYLVPKPLHSGQAPYGELKEKSLGSISGKEKPSCGHDHLADMRNSLVSLSPLVSIFRQRNTTSPSD